MSENESRIAIENPVDDNEKAINELLNEDARLGRELKEEASKIVSGGDLDIKAIEKRHALVKNLKEMVVKYKELGMKKSEIDPIERLIVQMDAIGTLTPLMDKSLLPFFSPRSSKDTDRMLLKRNKMVRLKLEKSRKYTFVDSDKLLPILRNRMPNGRKYYADVFMNVLSEFIIRKQLSSWAVWITNTMTSIYKLRNENYDYEFLQKIVDLMECTFNLKIQASSGKEAMELMAEGIAQRIDNDMKNEILESFKDVSEVNGLKAIEAGLKAIGNLYDQEVATFGSRKDLLVGAYVHILNEIPNILPEEFPELEAILCIWLESILPHSLRIQFTDWDRIQVMLVEAMGSRSKTSAGKALLHNFHKQFILIDITPAIEQTIDNKEEVGAVASFIADLKKHEVKFDELPTGYIPSLIDTCEDLPMPHANED